MEQNKHSLFNSTVKVGTSSNGFAIHTFEIQHQNKANHYLTFELNVIQNVENQVNDIIFYVMTFEQYVKWTSSCMQQTNSYISPKEYTYTSGKVAKAQNRLQITGNGTVILLFDNRYSTFTHKQVNISVEEERVEEKPIANPSTATARQKNGIRKSSVTSDKIFIVHGKDESAARELTTLLETLDLKPIVLSEQVNKGLTIIEKLERNTTDVGYAFIILMPDDVGGLFSEHSSCPACYSTNLAFELTTKKIVCNECKHVMGKELLNPRARQNVILELGYFMAKLGRSRICCLYKDQIDLPSDIHGIAYHKFDSHIKERTPEIISELKSAGYKIGARK